VNDSRQADRGTSASGGSHTDITIADASSAEIELGDVLDTVDTPIVVVGRDCSVTRFNRAAVETLGISSSDTGRLLGHHRSLSDVPGFHQECMRVMRDGLASPLSVFA